MLIPQVRLQLFSMIPTEQFCSTEAHKHLVLLRCQKSISEQVVTFCYNSSAINLLNYTRSSGKILKTAYHVLLKHQLEQSG